MEEAMKHRGMERQMNRETEGTGTYHTHQQLVKPLQLELGFGPHVGPQGRLEQCHTTTGQQLPGRAGSAGGVVHLQMHKCMHIHQGYKPSVKGVSLEATSIG